MDLVVPQFSLALPEIVLLCLMCMILVVDVYIKKEWRVVTYYLTQLALFAAIVLSLMQFKDYPTPIVTFSAHYVVDKLAILTKLFILTFSMLAFSYAREYITARHMARSEYYLLGLLAVLGMLIMASANSFLTIYLGLELLSICLYGMIAMQKESDIAIEAAMKYFILGTLASGILLYGISLLFGLTGSLDLNTIGQILQTRHDLLPVVALIFILGGLIFKFGAVPFHMWVPDVYQGSGTPTTLFIATAPKIAAFTITLRILVQGLPSLQSSWIQILIVISILSMGLGNLLAIAQTNLKRLLAYSSIAHMGYTLLGILAGPNSTSGYSAALFYIVTYVLVGAGAFAIITIMGRSGVEFDKLDDYRGLNARNPWLAFMMLILLFSMAGVPPTVGFIAKLALLEALVQANLVWLAVLALVFALIGAYYYLRVVMYMYFEEPSDEVQAIPIVMSREMFITMSVNGVATLALGLLPSYLINLCRITVG